MHYEIGTYIHGLCRLPSSSTSSAVQSPYLLLAADQWNRGATCIQGETDRVTLMQLNLNASRVARKQSAEGFVFEFLSKGASLIKEKDWDFSYELVLEIYNRLAAAESARSNFERSNQLVDVIVKFAKQPEGKASAHLVLAQTLSSQMQNRQAVEKSREALTALGVSTRENDMACWFVESFRVKRMLQGLSDDDLIHLPPMTDKRIKKAMRILVASAIFGFTAEDKICTGMVFCKMIELTLNYGWCPETSVAYAAYAQMLAHMDKYGQAYRFSQLALHANPTKENLPCTTSFIHGMCLHFQLPLPSSLNPTLMGYRIGIETGDLCFGVICLVKYIHLYLSCGLALQPFLSDLGSFVGQLKLFNQHRVLAFAIPAMLLVLNITGESDNPRDISWEHAMRAGILEDKELIPHFEETPGRTMLHYMRLFVAIVLHDMNMVESAPKSILILKKKARRFPATHFINYMLALMDGLAGFALYRKKRLRRYLWVARKGLNELKKMHTINSLPLLHLLEAEQEASFRLADMAAVKVLFDKAIASLVRCGNTHYGAIAYERAGRFMLNDGRDEFWAKEYLHQSLTLYQEWGALVKVREMTKEFPSIFCQKGTISTRVAGTAIHGRKRFGSIAVALHQSQNQTSAGLAAMINESSGNEGEKR